MTHLFYNWKFVPLNLSPISLILQPSTPLGTTCSFSVSMNLFLFCYFCSFVFLASTYMWNCAVFVLLWERQINLAWYPLGPSMSQMARFYSFLWLNNIPLYINTPHLLYPFICWWAFNLLPYLGYCKYAAVNIRVHVIFSKQCFTFLQMNT